MWCAPRVNLGYIVIYNVYNDPPLYSNDVPMDLNADDTTFYVIGEKRYYIKQNL